MAHFLYSTNAFLKYHVQEKYRNRRHFVWCSEAVDSSKLSAYTPGSSTPPSSNPADIYRQLKREVEGKDRHGDKITRVKAVLLRLASDWLDRGEITASESEEITYLANDPECGWYRPLLYVIPYALVTTRVESIPVDQRAHPLAPEYRVADLHRDEFDIVEL